MPDNRIRIDFDEERLLKAIKVGHYEFGPDIELRYVRAWDAPFDPFDPNRYHCSICGRSKVRLWRETRMIIEAHDKVELLCAFCIGDIEGIKLRGSKDLGKKITKSSTILYYFPAIPMMNGEEYLSPTTIRNATNDNALVNEWLKMDD